MEKLTNKEEEIMQVLWDLEKAFVKEVLPEIKDQKLHYNTVSTIVRILENKNFVGYRKQGRGHIYYPLIEKDSYSKFSMTKLLNNYFDGSVKSMLSFFVKKNDLSVRELEEVLSYLQ